MTSPLHPEQSDDLLARLGALVNEYGNERAALAAMVRERDEYRRRAHAAESALSDYRLVHERIQREWRGADRSC